MITERNQGVIIPYVRIIYKCYIKDTSFEMLSIILGNKEHT